MQNMDHDNPVVLTSVENQVIPMCAATDTATFVTRDKRERFGHIREVLHFARSS